MNILLFIHTAKHVLNLVIYILAVVHPSDQKQAENEVQTGEKLSKLSISSMLIKKKECRHKYLAKVGAKGEPIGSGEAKGGRGDPPPPQMLPNAPSNKIRSIKKVCTAFVKKADILRRDQRNTRSVM